MATTTDKSQIPLLQKVSRKALKKQKRIVKDGTHVVNIDDISKHHTKTRPHYERAVSVRERYDRVGDPINAHTYTEELLQKAEDNDFDACQNLLEKGAIVNIEDEKTKLTALHIAAKNGQHDILNLLLTKGADCNAQDNTGHSPLHLAVTKDYPFCCEILLKCTDLKVNIQNKTLDTPLHRAAKEGRIHICTMILQHNNIEINVRNDKGMSPLHLATLENHAEVIKLLIENGADCKMQDKYFHLPLHYAAQKGFPECCEVLLSICSDADKEKQLTVVLKDRKTPLMLAAKGGHHKCCAKLGNTSINAVDKEGNTALHYAAIGGFENTIELLLTMGAEPNTQNKKRKAPVHEAAGKKKSSCLKLLKDNCAKFDVVDEQNRTVLHYAAEKNAEDCLQYLLSLPDLKILDKKDKERCTALHIAIKRESVECAHILLKSGASPIEQCIGKMTPLHLAADKGYTSLCEVLLAKDIVQVSQENGKKATPLHLAALHGSVDVCQMLLRKGARLSAVDTNGRTALHIAANKGCGSVVKFLTKKGITQRTKDDTGSTALHLAASEGSLECCQLLVASAKATCNDIDHNGKLPFDRAFEKKHDSVFRFLLLQLPYKKDEEKRMACLHEYINIALEENRLTVVEAIIDSSWWQAGFRSKNEHHCQNFRQLVEYHPGLALKVQDKCVDRSKSKTIYDFRFYEDNYYIPTASSKTDESPFESESGKVHQNAQTFTQDDLEWKNRHPLTLMVSHSRHQLLKHSLTNAWLLHKWRSYIYLIFLALLLLELLFVGCLMAFMGSTDNWSHIETRCNLTREQFCRLSETWQEMKEPTSTPDTLIEGSLSKEISENFTLLPDNSTGSKLQFMKCNEAVPVKHGVFVCLLIITSITLLLECNYMYRLRNEYLSFNNLMQICRLIFSIIIIVPRGRCEFDHHILYVEHWQCGILALLVAWLHLINMLNQLPMLSVFMPITQSFLKSFFKVVFYIAMLIFIFAFIFHLLLRDQTAFFTVPQAMVKTIVWMLGDLAYDDTFLNDDHQLVYPVMVNLLFVVFVTTIGGFIVNLVITQPSEKLDSFRDKAVFYRAASRCTLFLKLEICFPFFRKYRTRGTYVDEETEVNGYNVLTKKLLLLDSKEDAETEPTNPLQLQLENQHQQINTLLTLHMEQREEIRDLKHTLNLMAKSLPGLNQSQLKI
ncbi:transient receptor potential cation channel subfamily A member 1 homolog isoform X2 [Procambarus clarkii]|nr:transient receptor potential cation channel subfamily A member 1 homolog [Procambarus clarkii]XP_045606737.1 transient receptor potential cation channel subfamily A member 1 homolog [Procambarus clarkii]